MSWSDKEMATKKQMDYIDSWKADNTDLIRFRVPKGMKTKYQKLAERSGANSLTAYLNQILEEKLKEEGL